MKRDPNDLLPVVGASSSELGVRIGHDVIADSAGNVVLNGNGMSVAPTWKDLPFTRIPKRLRGLVPGATGSNSTFCFAIGNGPFSRAPVANGLELIPDPGPFPKHGVVAPVRSVSLATYETDLHTTRTAWQVDEK